MNKTKKQKKRKQNYTKRRRIQKPPMYVIPSSTSLDIQHLSNRIAREIPRVNAIPSSYRPTINFDLVPLKSIPREPLLDCNIKDAFQSRASLLKNQPLKKVEPNKQVFYSTFSKSGFAPLFPKVALQIGIPGYIYGKYCHDYNSPEAKRFLLKNLSANKHVNPANIVPPIQSQGNCWFNAMFVMFFVSDKGRKFFHFFRQLMIEGRQRDGSVIPENIRNAFALLNFGIDACLTGNKFAYEFDTNSIIHQLFYSIPKKYRTDYVVDVKQASNPILYYTSIINYLNQGTKVQAPLARPSGEALPRTPPLSGFAPVSKKVDMLVLRKTKADWKEQALRYIRSSAHLPHVIVLEIFDDDAATFDRKPVSFQIDNSLYKIDSATIRDTTKQHFCSTITCETREMAYDGMSFHRLVPLVWKDKLNTDSNWQFAGTDEKLVWNFTKCYQMLLYYRST